MQPQKQIRHPVETLKRWAKAHPKSAVCLAVAALALLSCILVFALTQHPKQNVAQVVKKIAAPAPPPAYYSPLSGEKVDAETDTTKPVTAVMIENSPDARPQSGLKQAEVVYEAIAEGGITRFLALYQQSKPKLIGPVRSVRPYYVSWVRPYDASVAHVGGSSKALKMVRGKAYRDIDQFFNPNTYWRASDRYAPHNVYTNSKRLDALNKSKGFKISSPKPMARDDATFKGKEKATSIKIDISGPLYNSSYSYDPDTKVYYRSQAGAPHKDREKGRIAAKVVIAMKTTMRHVFEDGYRESITTTGSGKAYIFADGTVLAVRWHKDSDSDQLRFTLNDKEIKLPRGTTWITAIPKDDGGVSWK